MNKSFEEDGPPTLFISKLDASGAIAYSTYLGSSAGDFDIGTSAMAVDGSGDIFVTGMTLGTDFPVTANAFQQVNNGASHHTANAFITELKPNQKTLPYSTYLGGSGLPYTVVVPGEEFTFYIGLDSGYGIALDDSGTVYITGITTSLTFQSRPQRTR
jgi:hypothetical protein